MTDMICMHCCTLSEGKRKQITHTRPHGKKNHLRNADWVDSLVSLGHGGRRSLGSEAAKPCVSALSARTSSCNLAVNVREI